MTACGCAIPGHGKAALCAQRPDCFCGCHFDLRQAATRLLEYRLGAVVRQADILVLCIALYGQARGREVARRVSRS